MRTTPGFTRRAALAALPALAAILSLLTVVFGCATNPVTGRREFSLVSTGDEVRIGREGHQAIVAEYGVYDDPGLQAYVDSVGWRLARASQLPNLEWHFTILDDPVVNAFALPGGYIYITRGILAHLNSEAQLAGVLGHEIGHVTARHSAQRLTYQELAGVGLGVASMLSQTVQRYSGAAQTALGLVFLKYGRDDENQADALGIGYAAGAGYDPREVPSTYAMLKRIGERSGQRLPSFLSTHPDPGDREARTTALAAQAVAGKSGLQVRQRAYLQRLEGTVFGADPRQGYFEGARYYHPALGFTMTLPAGWKYQDTRTAVTAAEPNQRGAMQLALAQAGDLAPADYVTTLVRDGRVLEARGAAESIGGFPAWVGRLAAAGKDNAPVALVAAYVRKSPQQLFEVLGRSAAVSDAIEGSIFASARSFQALTDPARLQPVPERLRLKSVTVPGTFESVVKGLGPQGLDLEGTAILNNAQPDETVLRGTTLKIVEPGRTH